MKDNPEIIIVDDHPLFREGIKLLIEKEMMGVVVAEAKNGLEFLNLLEKFTPDLILMDIMMPGTPVREIIPKLGKFKIAYLSVVRTSEAEKEDLMKNKNIIDFIQKPFDIDELLKRVKKLVG